MAEVAVKGFKSPKLDWSALCSDLNASRRALRFPRECRARGVADSVGKWFSEEGSSVEMPVNMLFLYGQIVGQKLIAKNPRVILGTDLKPMKPTVAVMQQWANDEIEHMNLEGTLGRAAFDALWDTGCIKVALAEPDDSAKQAWNLESGCAFAEVIDFDDLVFDTNAHSFDQCKFIGHRFRVPLDTIKDNPHYRPARKDLQSTPPKIYNEDGSERTSTIGSTTFAQQGDQFDPQVDLWEIYLPRHRIIVTFQADELGNASVSTSGTIEPLRVQPWIGPYCGPYHFLTLGPPVPGSARGASVFQNLVDLNRVENELYRKLFDQALRQKTLGLVKATATDDGEKVKNARDGELIGVNDPEAVQNAEFGGPNQVNLQFGMHVDGLFKKQGGNLDALGGLAPQSGTAKQDSMLNENASAVMSDMQSKMIDFVSKVVESLCWFWYHDPHKVMQVYHAPNPALPNIGIRRKSTPQNRNWADWKELRVEVDPYSMQHQTPQQRAAKLTQLVTQIIIPSMAILQQQGIAFDIGAYLKIVGELEDIPNLPEIVTVGEPPQPEQASPGGGDQPGMPANTSRTYERISRPAGTQGAEENRMMTAINSAKEQQQ